MYKLTPSGCLRLEDGVHIPDDPQNMDWVAYQEWVNQGNIPEPAGPSREAALRMEGQTLCEKLAGQCKADPLWGAGTPAQISNFIDWAFPESSNQQRLVLKFLLYATNPVG